MGQVAHVEAQRCGCCSGAGAKVITESLLADPPCSPGEAPRKLSKEAQREASADDSGGTAGLPSAAALSDRAGAAECSGGTGGSEGAIRAASRASWASPADTATTIAARARQGILGSLKDGSLHGLCAEAETRSSLVVSEKEELSGLQWAKAFGNQAAAQEDDLALAKELASAQHGRHTEPSSQQSARRMADDDLEAEADEDDEAPKTAPAGGGKMKGLERGASTIAEAGDEGNETAKSKKGVWCSPFQRRGLSKKTQKKVEDIFEGILNCGKSGKLAREDAEMGFLDSFGGTAKDIFKEDAKGCVSLPEFLDLCTQVKHLGFSEKDILDQLEEFLKRRSEDLE